MEKPRKKNRFTTDQKGQNQFQPPSPSPHFPTRNLSFPPYPQLPRFRMGPCRRKTQTNINSSRSPSHKNRSPRPDSVELIDIQPTRLLDSHPDFLPNLIRMNHQARTRICLPRTARKKKHFHRIMVFGGGARRGVVSPKQKKRKTAILSSTF
jgi:hypothetical protein